MQVKANAGLWRTPECAKGGTVSDEVLEKMAGGEWKRKSGHMRQLRLQDQVRHKDLWPTPCRKDFKGANTPAGLTRNDGKSRMDQLPNAVKYAEPNCERRKLLLNPTWTEILMGWPQNWTSLDAPVGRWISPDMWIDGSWEDGIERVCESSPSRAHRIRAIGNGQVPQTVLLAWEILNHGEKQREIL